MKSKNLILILFCFTYTISAYTQNYNLNIIKKDYPAIYASIVKHIEDQWTGDLSIKQAAMEGQAEAFLDIAEPQEPIDDTAMTNAILNNSLKGEKEYNLGILEDLSIRNPFPLLRCDWYNVKIDYIKTLDRTLYTVNEGQSQRDRQYGGNRILGSPNSDKNSAKSRFGIKIGLGWTILNGSKKFELLTGLKEKAGFIADIGFLGQIKKNNMFLQGELAIATASYNFSGYIAYTGNDYYYETSSGPTFGYIKALCYGGINKDLNNRVNLILGAGPYVACKFKINGDFYDEYYWEDDWVYYSSPYSVTAKTKSIESSGDISSEDLRTIDFGLSLLAGVEINQFQITIQPSFGLVDMSKDNYGLRTIAVQLSAAYLF